MHPWAAYLITKDLLERHEPRRASNPLPVVQPRAMRRAAALGSRPVRAMGCVA